jgi:uncharacterized membrane protein YedE/YeeE
MNIDWLHFTPGLSFLGGLLLGLASAAFILINGRILGISGILGGFIVPKNGDIAWRVAFILGMAASPFLASWIFPTGVLHAPKIDSAFLLIAIAGLLVGFGTRYGSGCTSGHGICGLSRLSIRSVVATLTFMGTGFLTTYCVRHVF